MPFISVHWIVEKVIHERPLNGWKHLEVIFEMVIDYLWEMVDIVLRVSLRPHHLKNKNKHCYVVERKTTIVSAPLCCDRDLSAEW